MAQSSLVYAASSATVSTASTEWYGPWNAQGALTQLETSAAPTQAIFRGSATLRNFYVRPHVNSRATNSSVNFRVNGTTQLTLTMTAGSTAVVSDTTTSVPLSSGDTWNYSIATGTGAGALGVNLSAELSCSGQSFTTMCCFGSASSSTSIRYWLLGGQPQPTGTEANANAKALEGATISNLQIYIRTNPSAAGFDVRSRKNTANGNMLIAAATIGTGTGWFEDTTNSDTLSAGDNFCVSTSAPSAAITVGYVGVKYQSATPGGSVLSGQISGTSLPAAATRYTAFGANFDASEAQNQISAPFTGTLSKLSAWVQSFGSSTDVTFVSRVNGADGVNVVTLTSAGSPGIFQDTTHTDSFTAAQTLGAKASGATTSSVTIGWVGALITGPASSTRGLLLLGVG